MTDREKRDDIDGLLWMNTCMLIAAVVEQTRADAIRETGRGKLTGDDKQTALQFFEDRPHIPLIPPGKTREYYGEGRNVVERVVQSFRRQEPDNGLDHDGLPAWTSRDNADNRRRMKERGYTMDGFQ